MGPVPEAESELPGYFLLERRQQGKPPNAMPPLREKIGYRHSLLGAAPELCRLQQEAFPEGRRRRTGNAFA